MPPVESLNADSNYAAFLSPNVSEELRRIALRKLFHLPHLNITDGLDDYAEDYHGFTALGDIITADMRHQMERRAEELRARRDEQVATRGDGDQAASAGEGSEPGSASPETGTRDDSAKAQATSADAPGPDGTAADEEPHHEGTSDDDRGGHRGA